MMNNRDTRDNKILQQNDKDGKQNPSSSETKKSLKNLLLSISDQLNILSISEDKIARVLDEHRAIYKAGSLVRLAIESYDSHASKRNIKLKLHIDPSSISIYVDPLRFEMIVQSLLSIALRATKDNGIIHICSKLSGTEYVITIKDSGTPAQINKIREYLDYFLNQNSSFIEKDIGVAEDIELSFGKSMAGKVNLCEGKSGGLRIIYSVPVETAHMLEEPKEDFLEMTLGITSGMRPHLPPEWDRVDFQKNLMITKMYSYIKENIRSDEMTVEHLAVRFNRSRRSLYRFIKAELNMTPAQMIREIRLEKAHEMLKEFPLMTVAEVAYQVGYLKSDWFEKLFEKRFGVPPKSVKN